MLFSSQHMSYSELLIVDDKKNKIDDQFIDRIQNFLTKTKIYVLKFDYKDKILYKYKKNTKNLQSLFIEIIVTNEIE